MKNDVVRCLICGLLLAIVSEQVMADSLYSEQEYTSLVADHRGRKVGDLVTVQILESSTASSSADRDTNKSLDLSGFVKGTHSPLEEVGVGFSNDSKGGGSVSRSGRLVASVSVSVERVLPNGDMWVKGEQAIMLNEEKQTIKVEGRVRPEDLSPQNTVLSSRMSDAKIEYVGEGLLGGRQAPGFITRFFNWLF